MTYPSACIRNQYEEKSPDGTSCRVILFFKRTICHYIGYAVKQKIYNESRYQAYKDNQSRLSKILPSIEKMLASGIV